MKTSNKLIGFGIFMCSVCAISFMVAAKSSMVDKVVEEKNDIEQELAQKLSNVDKSYVERSLGVLSASTLDLDRNHRYILDPTTNIVTVTGPKYIVTDFEELTGSKYFEAPVFHEVSSEKDFRNNSKVFNGITDTLFYNIGIRDLESLKILIGDESKVTAKSSISLQNLKIFMEGNSHFEAELNCESLAINSEGSGHLRLSGTAKEAEFMLEDNSNLECYGLNIQDVEIMQKDNSQLELNTLRNLSGVIRDNAYYGNAEKIGIENLIVKNNARVDHK